MDPIFHLSPSQLFTIRLWKEQINGGEQEWRGYVLHIATQRGRFFREWPALMAFLQEVLSEGEEAGAGSPGI